MKETIGLQTLRKNWQQITFVLVLIVCIRLFHPPFWLIIAGINTIIIVRSLLKKVKAKAMLKSMAQINVIFAGIYLIYWLVGGIWAVIIIHVVLISKIIHSQWDFIKEADRQMKQQLDIIIEKRRVYKEWELKQQKKGKSKLSQ